MNQECLHKDEETCEKKIDYPYLIHNADNTKQCSNKCEGIISLNGTDYYTDNNYKCPENSDILEDANPYVCKYK